LNPLCLFNCIRFAARAGNVRVINLSWGGSRTEATRPDVPDQERDSIQAFCNTGGIVVVAAGNGDPDTGIGYDVIRPESRDYPSALAEDLAGA
jgi:hypothetical protein